uniref:F-box/LRR-repeat protein 15/At3g58940/PEG3-like LRR domain-containing protein n=1 Tax=Setaria viridis TaxID=4556 RepID=A0A4U6U9U8_SETVI|nr:hypothetical protein SEVIR_6G181000v2 [Setaria viridis]
MDASPPRRRPRPEAGRRRQASTPSLSATPCAPPIRTLPGDHPWPLLQLACPPEVRRLAPSRHRQHPRAVRMPRPRVPPRFRPQKAYGHMEEWLRLLAGKERGPYYIISHFTLRFREYLRVEIYMLYPTIFSCCELTHLTLHNCYLPAAPSSFTRFPKLTWLSLTTVGFHEHGERDLEAMIHMSPFLETLELRDVWILGDEFDEWVIQVPNLRNLTFVADEDYELQIGDLPSLEEANISIETYYYVDRDFTIFSRFDTPSKLCNVSRILSIFSLLRSAPNLQQLKTKIMDCQTQNDEIDLDFFSALCTNSLFTKLKIVTISNAILWSNEMHFIEFILSKARLLCAPFVYQDDDGDPSKPSEEAVIQLTKFRRAPPKVRVLEPSM